MFVLNPTLLMIEGNFLDIGWSLITAMIGMVAVGAGLIGFWYRKINWFERIISVVTGLLLMYPEGYSDTIGFIAFVILVAIQFMTKDKGQNNQRGNLEKAGSAG